MTDKSYWLDHLMTFVFVVLGINFGLTAYRGYTLGQLDMMILFGIVSSVMVIVGFVTFYGKVFSE